MEYVPLTMESAMEYIRFDSMSSPLAESHGCASETKIVVKKPKRFEKGFWNFFEEVNWVEVGHQVQRQRAKSAPPGLTIRPHDEIDHNLPPLPLRSPPRLPPPSPPPLPRPNLPPLPRPVERFPAPGIDPQGNRISWTVEAGKLKTSNQQLVSDEFDLFCMRPVKFKMILQARKMHNGRGGNMFKTAKGRGYVELKCLEDLDAADDPIKYFRISLGVDSRISEWPKKHDFSDIKIKRWPEEFDFQTHADKSESKTFTVVLEVCRRR